MNFSKIPGYSKWLIKNAVYAIVAVFAFFASNAQTITNKQVFINKGTINTYDNAGEWLKNNTGKVKLPIQVLVQFNVLPTQGEKEWLGQNGIMLVQYIPDNAYVAILSSYPDLVVLQKARVKFITDVATDWKISDGLLADIRTAKDGITELSVAFTSAVNEAIALDHLSSLGAVVISNRISSMGYCNISLQALQIEKLAGWYGVSYMNTYTPDVPLNIDVKALTRTQIVASPASMGGLGLRGAGTTIGVGDNTSGIFHTDLMDRTINYNAHGYTNHGVHINGIAGGAGIVDPKGEGIAPEAMLSNHYFSDVLDATPEISQLHNVIVTNNSYSASQGSCTYAGTYDALSAGLDKLCNEYNTVFQVFAAANDGLFDCPPYPKGFATIAGGYQVAKNNIVVASTDKMYVNADNSSRGPVKDGRLKPEISAVGFNVNSTTRNDEYLVASGTSMACPQVAGAAALLAERMKQLNGTSKPQSDVLKSLLINGATDIGIPGPDYRFGFGFLNTERSLIMLDSNRYITGTVLNAGQATHTINVPANTSRLKVFLCWHDAPSSPMTTKQLVNDIDLDVTEPGSAVRKPLVLDPAPANINNPAVEKEDRLNNSEQVVIDNPVAGNYTITVKGHSVPSGSQRYVIAYDFLPQGISIKYPIAGAQLKSNDSSQAYIYWDATNGSNNFTLEYSIDGGGVWNLIDNNIPAEQRYYKWLVPDNTNSGKCRIRLTRNNTSEQSVTDLFVINAQPLVQLSATQCPGYMQVEWGAIPNATAYEVMKKEGAALAIADTVISTNFVFRGLSLDSIYYVSVRPLIDGLSGYRSIAVKRRPNDGNCSGNISDGDLMVEKILGPISGRVLTSAELTSNEALTIRLRNLDDMPCNNYKVSYSINGGAWVAQAFADPLPANGAKAISVLGLNLSAQGDYSLRIAVENTTLPDSVPANDSAVHYVSQLPNPPVMLDFSEDFETLTTFTKIRDTAGFGNNRRWDYQNTTDTGRLRSFAFGGTTINGQRSVNLDAYKSCPGNFNALTGTFNMAGYNANTDEVRLEFEYIIHGVPKSSPGNELEVRGTDTKPFHITHKYNLKSENKGKVTNSGSISLSDVMLNTGDNFSASTQLQFGQNDTSLIAGRGIGNGMTIDDVRLYTVQNDVQLLSVVAPDNFACGVTGSVPLTIKVRNGVNIPQNNVQLNFRLDKGSVITETIISLAGKESIDYTFSKLLDISAPGNHLLDVWLSATGDSYTKNDSILNYSLRNQPLINSYPYSENFEVGDGYWYEDGINSSWAYGTPAKPKINGAASGQKAWVTNLTGNYNDEELSYLYSPCFDISGMANPRFSCKLALDIENCNIVLCDAGFMDYSTDGENWTRLGDYGEGTNWYTDSNYRIWTIEDKTAWHQVQIPLLKVNANLQLRIGLLTDPGSTREGIGVDDIYIFDEKLNPADNEIISISPNPTEDGVINIEWSAHGGTELKLAMTDVMGKEVYRASAVAQEGYNKTTLNTPLFSTGMYFMRITIGEKNHKRKIVFRRR